MDEKITPFICLDCGRVVDFRRRFCSTQCEDNYKEEKAYMLEREIERINP